MCHFLKACLGGCCTSLQPFPLVHSFIFKEGINTLFTARCFCVLTHMQRMTEVCFVVRCCIPDLGCEPSLAQVAFHMMEKEGRKPLFWKSCSHMGKTHIQCSVMYSRYRLWVFHLIWGSKGLGECCLRAQGRVRWPTHHCSVNSRSPTLVLHTLLLSQEHKGYFQAANPQQSGKLQPCMPLKASMTF